MKKLITFPSYRCTLCNKEIQSNSLKYNNEGKITCMGCYNQTLKQKTSTSQKTQETKLGSEAEESGYMKVVCVDCDYKFRFKKSFKVICPYCGGNKLVKYEDITTEKLLGEC